MTIQRSAFIVALLCGLAPAAAVAQTNQSESVTRTSVSGGAASSRRMQSKTESGGREVVTETTEVPGPDGKFRLSSETTTETTRTGPDSSQSKRDVYGSDSQGQRKLLQTTQSEQQKLSDGTSRTVENTFAPDLNGRLALSSRQIEETRSLGPNSKQTDTTIFRPGINESLRESERVQQTERKVSSDLTQNESTRSVRDGNGRWQTTETRNKDTRKVSASENVDEEVVRRVDANGTFAVSERKVTRQMKTTSQDEVVTETYAPSTIGPIRSSDNRLELSQRLRTTTTSTGGGGRQTVREVEAKNPLYPNGSLQVVERTVETFRQVGPDRWEVERQVFAMDGNGRLVPVFTEKGEAAGK